MQVFNFCLVAPNITSEIIDQTKNEGDTVSFTCQATGEPASTISWLLNEVKINTKMNKYDTSQSSFNITVINTLTITNVQSSDVGTYTCNATNIVSSDTSSGILTVNGKFIFLLQPKLTFVNYFV